MRIIFVFLLLPFLTLAKSNLDISLPQENLRSKEELLAPFAGDIQIGNSNAKVKVVIFDSYSCHHCAKLYNEVFPVLEKKYIKTGKIAFIHKEFPLDKLALFASKVVHCSKNPQKTMNEIYSKQENFLTQNYEEKLLLINGIDKTCVQNFDEKTITKPAYEYSKVLKIHSTPTIYINGEILSKKGLKYFIAKIEEYLKK